MPEMAGLSLSLSLPLCAPSLIQGYREVGKRLPPLLLLLLAPLLLLLLLLPICLQEVPGAAFPPEGLLLISSAPARCRYLANRSKRHTLAMTNPTAEIPPDLQRQLGQQPFRSRAAHLAPEQHR